MLKNDESGISPVVGTILLIGVTVALAAVVATLVGGLGSGGAPPSAQLAVAADNDASNTIEITHEGGDDIVVDEVKAIVKKDGNKDAFNSLSTIADTDSTFTVGETITISSDNLEEISTIETGDVLTVYVIHKPSGQKLYSNDGLTVS